MLTPLAVVRQQLDSQSVHHLQDLPSTSLTPGPGMCLALWLRAEASAGCPCHQGQRQQQQRFQSVLLMGFQFMLVEFQPASWSSLPECLLCGLQTPTSDKEITALQSLLNQLPQFPESPDRLTHIQSLIFYSDSTAAQWGKNSLFNKQGWSIGNPYEKNASYFIPHTIYKI